MEWAKYSSGHFCLLVRSAFDSCTSTRVLQGFSWLCTLFCTSPHHSFQKSSSLSALMRNDTLRHIVFLYLAILLSSALVHYKLDDTIWHASVRRYDWYRHEKIPASPTTPQLPKLRTSLVAPQPRRPVMLSTQSALDARYTVEHLSPNATSVFSHERPVPPVPAAPPAQSVMQETRQLELSNELAMPSLYPKHLASAWTFPQSSSTSLSPPKPTISRSQPGLSSSSSSVPPHTELQPTLSHPQDEPPPLGQWPRKDIMKQPALPPKTPPKRTTPRKPPPSAFTLVPQTPPSPTSVPPPAASASASLSPALVTPPVRRSIDSDRSFDSVQSSPGTRLGVRPSGPRRRSSDLRRPAPLDLSRLSNGRT